MNPKQPPPPIQPTPLHLYTDFDDGSAAPTYLITPSFTCQNPSHSHHISQFPPSYRQNWVDTVVEESTGGSVITVIDTNRSGCADNDRNQMPAPSLPPPLLSSTPITKAINIPSSPSPSPVEQQPTAIQMDSMDTTTPSHLQPSPPTPSIHSDTINVHVDHVDAMQSNEAGTDTF